MSKGGFLLLSVEAFNSFISRSVDAFCYDDDIHFEFRGTDLVIVKHEPDADSAWRRNGEKLARLHNYWFYRAIDAFVASGMATERIGLPEHRGTNQLAFIKAIRIRLQLTEVFGLDESVSTDTGLRVNLFQALLSLELMTVFYDVAFVRPYFEYLNETRDWRLASRRLAMAGMQQGLQLRFPVTWSDRKTKIKNIRSWTVSEEFPHGDAKGAEAILDFWTNDLKALSTRLRASEPGSIPRLFERPVLKMGRYLFQLPWMVAMQNNSAAAINNLRRIGARRLEAREEAGRIEQRLASLSRSAASLCARTIYRREPSITIPARWISSVRETVDCWCWRSSRRF